MKKLFASFLLMFQTVYVDPTPPTPFNLNSDQRKLIISPLTGPSLLYGQVLPLNATPPNVLMAVPNAAVGQAAVDSCTAGTLPPISDPLGVSPPSCENQRQPAIQADIVKRLNDAVSTISPAVLTADNLFIAPNFAKNGPALVTWIWTGVSWQVLPIPVPLYDPSLAGVNMAVVNLQH